MEFGSIWDEISKSLMDSDNTAFLSLIQLFVIILTVGSNADYWDFPLSESVGNVH